LTAGDGVDAFVIDGRPYASAQTIEMADGMADALLDSK